MLKIIDVINQIPIIESDETIEIINGVEGIKAEKFIKNNNYRLFARKTNIENLYKYGSQQLISGGGHGIGYVWQSRCSLINGQLNLNLSEVRSVNGNIFGLDINVIKSLLEEYYDCSINIETITFGDNDNKEIKYNFVKA